MTPSKVDFGFLFVPSVALKESIGMSTENQVQTVYIPPLNCRKEETIMMVYLQTVHKKDLRSFLEVSWGNR